MVWCRSVVIVLTGRFLDDPWCLDITLQAMSHMHPLVPVLLQPINIEGIDDEPFASVLNVYRPISWSNDSNQRVLVLEELRARLQDERDGEDHVTTSLLAR